MRLARPPDVDGFPITNAFLTWFLSARPFRILKSVCLQLSMHVWVRECALVCVSVAGCVSCLMIPSSASIYQYHCPSFGHVQTISVWHLGLFIFDTQQTWHFSAPAPTCLRLHLPSSTNLHGSRKLTWITSTSLLHLGPFHSHVCMQGYPKWY